MRYPQRPLSDFNPRSPRGERRTCTGGCRRQMRYFNPRSPRGERLAVKDLQARAGIISTHAPREGSDRGKRHLPGSTWHFNPRSPRGERPTHDGHGRPRGDFNPRSPRGERPTGTKTRRTTSRNFNPRSPRGERHSAVFAFQLIYVFQPALPARGATSAPISCSPCMIANFNPRSPRVERLKARFFAHCFSIFQPALPARGATRTGSGAGAGGSISTRAPREGSDQRRWAASSAPGVFQPALPARGATSLPSSSLRIKLYFNPRSPRGERRLVSVAHRRDHKISTRAPREGSDTSRERRNSYTQDFNPRSPQGERRLRPLPVARR